MAGTQRTGDTGCTQSESPRGHDIACGAGGGLRAAGSSSCPAAQRHYHRASRLARVAGGQQPGKRSPGAHTCPTSVLSASSEDGARASIYAPSFRVGAATDPSGGRTDGRVTHPAVGQGSSFTTGGRAAVEPATNAGDGTVKVVETKPGKSITMRYKGQAKYEAMRCTPDEMKDTTLSFATSSFDSLISRSFFSPRSL
ncbi:hypothetical protein GLOTRDRAFT_133121 [Gloeophyllum trabeum ATCC 11539]|uniref:Uncharacterized protein n=1 Tax=Gloeophyllum trabeum (strain ATCC 11539 / FP-39264 / Madison 617) TaxID=670483 RepID=S7RAF4_GLOTA|nr:uncharacterized protein GLOTRDRAFT_133121 [Gloeophyllum trabeum ATCC 11539]EPQ51240.1 hypothetical protein GLOTRDRAFT_133121 [Gloeophyllum trabeum ATCC 11539]